MRADEVGLDEESVVAEVAREHDRLVAVQSVRDAAGDPMLTLDGEQPVGVDAEHERRRGHACQRILDPSAWRRLSAGAGAKGERLFDWAYLELADLEAAEYNERLSGPWTRGLLIRRHIADGDLAFFTTWCPAGTAMETLVAVEGRRWAIEDGFETAKNELGLDHNETRSWHGWHRHVSLVMLAFAMLAVIRHKANAMTLPKKPSRTVTRSRT